MKKFMKNVRCLLSAAAIPICGPASVYADVIFEPVGGGLGSLVIFAAVLAVLILLVTALLLIIIKKKGKK